jgi:hypothetical protein
MAKVMTNFTGRRRSRPQSSESPQALKPVLESEPDEGDGDREAVERFPTGKISEVLSWVNNDKGRAQRALDVESTDRDPRKGLINRLKEILSK